MTSKGVSEAEFRVVLAQHPLQAGEGYYAGTIFCATCDLVLGDPVDHLSEVLARALGGDSRPPVAPQAEFRADRRESQTVWGAAS